MTDDDDRTHPEPVAVEPYLPPPLLRRFPELDPGRLPWLKLGRYPTPVTEVAGLGLPLWVKREELSSPGEGLPGGNKLRKLEPLLGEALCRGARVIVSSGARGSNHLLACARWAARLGLGAICAVGPQPETETAAQSYAALQRTRARVVHVPRLSWTPVVALALRLAGRGRFLIPPGGSGPRGVLGSLAAGLELAEQVAAGELPCPAEIWVAAGSGGTLAGLLLGLELGGLPQVRLVGVQVVPWPVLTKSLVLLECRAALSLLTHMGIRGRGRGRPRASSRARIVLLREQLGAGYGHPTPAGLAAIDRLEHACGIRLEPTYTGKALAGLLERAEARRAGGGPFLFWNTYAGPPGPPGVGRAGATAWPGSPWTTERDRR